MVPRVMMMPVYDDVQVRFQQLEVRFQQLFLVLHFSLRPSVAVTRNSEFVPRFHLRCLVGTSMDLAFGAFLCCYPSPRDRHKPASQSMRASFGFCPCVLLFVIAVQVVGSDENEELSRDLVVSGKCAYKRDQCPPSATIYSKPHVSWW